MYLLCLILGSWFWTLTAATVATTVADVELTQHCLRAGTCREGNLLLPASRGKMYAIQLPLAAASSYVAYRLHRKQKRYWWVPQASVIAGHGAGIGFGMRFVW